MSDKESIIMNFTVRNKTLKQVLDEIQTILNKEMDLVLVPRDLVIRTLNKLKESNDFKDIEYFKILEELEKLIGSGTE